MPSNQTQNYHLSQWELDDKVQREDFNADNAAIETALTALAAQDATLNSALAQKGNCTIETFTYTGTGSSGSANPTRVTFSKVPTAYIIFGSAILIGWGGSNRATRVTDAADLVTPSWSGSTLLISDNSAAKQLNSGTYYVIAFYK